MKEITVPGTRWTNVQCILLCFVEPPLIIGAAGKAGEAAGLAPWAGIPLMLLAVACAVAAISAGITLDKPGM